MEREEEEAKLTPTQLLQLAETHLRVRNFSLCRQYALESHHPDDPQHRHNHRRAAHLVTISDILLAATAAPDFTNWYSVLQVDTFSDDHNLIRSQFNKLLNFLNPIKDKFPLANEALDFVFKAYNSLSNPTSKSQLDSQLADILSNHGDGEGEGSFWTFCPYCFYVYQYARVYEGCCLRCQNETCRRVFHGVSLCSLPRMDLDKGQYFGRFGYFPLGFSPSECEEKGKFASWSPIVGLFPVRRTTKIDLGSDDNFVEILDDSDESESAVHGNENEHETGGENFGSHVGVKGVPSAGPNAEKPRTMRWKTVACNANKLMGKRKRSSEDADEDRVFGFENTHDVAGGSGGLDADDMKFFEEDGEVFVGLGPADAF